MSAHACLRCLFFNESIARVCVQDLGVVVDLARVINEKRFSQLSLMPVAVVDQQLANDDRLIYVRHLHLIKQEVVQIVERHRATRLLDMVRLLAISLPQLAEWDYIVDLGGLLTE